MQMPGQQRARKPSPNVMTGILLCAVVALAAATVVVFLNAQKIAPESGIMGVFKVQDPSRIELPNADS
jgi:hypothetical protein